MGVAGTARPGKGHWGDWHGSERQSGNAVAHLMRLERVPPPSTWELFLNRRMPMWAVMLIVLAGAVGAIIFGALVRDPDWGGPVGAVATDIAAIPQTLSRLMRGDRFRSRFYPGDYARIPGGFWRNTAQPFVDPGYMVFTAYDEAARRPEVRLMRLSDGRIVHRFRPDIDAINARSTFQSPLIDLKRDRHAGRNLMMHPLLMPDGGLVIHDSSPLARVDACGHVKWMVDGIFHHSVEPASDGSLWAVYRYPVSPLPNVAPGFDDEALAHVSADGKPLGLARVADILDRNGLSYLWRGRPYTDDPFHLNDVQPVPGDGPYWKKGDLFLSLRNMSLVLLYRPSTGRILWHHFGPWAMQHDVSVIDDHRIALFDNHWRFAAPEGEVDGTNRIPVYDFGTGQVTYPFARATERTQIRTRAQGRATPMANGDMFVEDTERGRVMRLTPDGQVRWMYIAADAEGRRYELRWSRYLDPTTDGTAIQAAENARCS